MKLSSPKQGFDEGKKPTILCANASRGKRVYRGESNETLKTKDVCSFDRRDKGRRAKRKRGTHFFAF